MSSIAPALVALPSSRAAKRAFWTYFGAVAVLCIVSALTLHFRYEETLARARTETKNLSFILSDHLSRSIESVDRNLKHLATQLSAHEDWSDVDVGQLLNVNLAALSDVASLSIVDENGKILHSTTGLIVGASRKEQYLFKALARARQNGLLADTPFSSQFDGRRLLPVGRRLEGPDGKFRGMIAATLEPKRLLAFYQAVDLGGEGCLWVGHPSGSLIFLEPRRAQETCAKDVEAASTSYIRSSRSISTPPLEVGVSLSKSFIDAKWRQEAAIAALLLIGLSVGLAVARLLYKNLLQLRTAAHEKMAETSVALRRTTEENRRLFDTTLDLIFITDRLGAFVRVSPSCRAILGYEPEEMVGRSGAEFIFQPDLDPTREEMRKARRGRDLRNFESRYLHKDGHAVPLAWSGVWSEEEQKFFFIGRDQTESKKRQEELGAQNLVLDAALRTMSQGLAMFDRNQNLVFANQKFAAMYAQASDEVRPGSSLASIIKHRIDAGFYIGTSVEEVLGRMKERVARLRPSHMTSRLGDGRTVAVSIEPLPDGGWVTTHQDITEREKLKERLDAALNNMVQGLAMFDADKRLVLCNRRYSGIYGLSEEYCRPGTDLRSILEARVAMGVYKQTDATNVIEVGIDTFSTEVAEVLQLADGRCISVVRRPLPTGGVISTHEDITDRCRMEARLAYLAHHDALTDLPNRVSLDENVGRLLASTRTGRQAVVMCLDLDRFKEINDTLGHAMGDALLKSIAQRVRGCLRDSDFVARLGGDEFAVVQVTPEPRRDAPLLAQRIIEQIAAPHLLLGHQIVVGASIGIAIAPTDGDRLDQLLRNADLALYNSKADGRGTFKFYEASMHVPVRARRALETDLHVALEQGQFSLVYQPLVNLETDKVCGCEALLRWKHPERGWIAPGDFIAAAETSGLIVPIGEWVLREACHEAASWPPHQKIAVNLSPLQVKSPNCVQSVVSALAYSGLTARRLEIEITESVLLSDDDATLAVLRQLHGLGVRIALDDFGTGYSSLSYLRRFPFSKLKIDRSFISDIHNESSLSILKTIAQLGRSLGMITTAEGIETEEQLAIARADGCVEAQGYFLGRPAPAEDVRRLILEATATAA